MAARVELSQSRRRDTPPAAADEDTVFMEDYLAFYGQMSAPMTDAELLQTVDVLLGDSLTRAEQSALHVYQNQYAKLEALMQQRAELAGQLRLGSGIDKASIPRVRNQLNALDAQIHKTRSSLRALEKNKRLAQIVEKVNASLKQRNQDSVENTTNHDIMGAGSFTDHFSTIFPRENPRRSLELVNPNFSTKEYRWINNCQRCVPAYELRMRGFDVTAKPIPGPAETDYLAKDFTKAWTNKDVIACRDGNGLEQVKAQMVKWGDGARAEVSVAWKGKIRGHVFVAEQINGETVFIDPQSGAENCIDYFSRVQPGSVKILRIDNNTPSDDIYDCCEERRYTYD